MDQLNFKAGDTVTAIIDSPGREGRYVVRGVVRLIERHPYCLCVGQDLIVHHDEVPSWITVLPASVSADVAEVERAAVPA